jgi:AraC-like DNA-binding protein
MRVDLFRHPDVIGVDVAEVRHAERYEPRVTSTFKIALIADRPKRYLYDGRAHVVLPGTLIMAAAGALHGAERADGPYRATVVSIDELTVGARLSAPWPTSTSLRTLAAFGALITAITRPDLPPLAVDRALAELIRALPEAPPPPRSQARDLAEVMKARDLLRARFTEPVRLDELVSATGIPKPRFLRSFKRLIGIPPHEYQLQLRVDLARRLIAKGRPIVDVAQQSGFFDQSHLHRHFRRIIGVAPGAYAREL